ncbi:MAG TPA: FAD-dependent oxidoreductase [Syntrophorhabdaceae bacterium]|nr:FAD-dependent oxidoreductase [Syntrophorhabdaceae bacterium]
MFEGRTHRPVIEMDRCKVCNICIDGCPAEAIPEYREEEMSLRGAVYREKITEERPEKHGPPPPCQRACPIHQDTVGYARLIAEGKFEEALSSILEVNPLPAVCGFICHHGCEEACLRGSVDQPVALRLLKKFVSDYAKNGRPERVNIPMKERREKVLVVGSGPAGLAAAHDLALLGYGVTIMEKLPVLGGMLAVGIPEFRLPRDILQMEIERIKALGIEMKTNSTFILARGIQDVKGLGYHAIFLANGAQKASMLEIEGSDTGCLISGLDLLKNLHLGRRPSVGKTVLVIGGGNVAIDVARSVRRVGASQVTIVCIESRDQMPAMREEVEEALEEGITIYPGASPIRIAAKNGRVAAVDFLALSGSAGELPVTAGATFTIKANTVVAAIGQKVDKKGLAGLKTNLAGTLAVDPETGATNVNGIFAGGDLVTGPGWAIDAIAAGKKGAASIHKHLCNEPAKGNG